MKKISGLILLFVLICTTNVYPQGNESLAKGFFIDGKSAELRGQYKEAIENYITALKYQNSAGIYYALSNAYYNIGKYKEATLEIYNALKLEPYNIDYLDQKAKLLFSQDRLSEAAEVYEYILTLDSNYTFSLFALARIYSDLKEPSKAVIYYEKITDEIGFDLEILKKMYDIYYNYKDYEKCALIVEYALKLDPYNSLFLQQLAALYTKLNRDDDAQKIFENLFLLNPENKSIQTELVKLYFKGNETEKGFENYSKTLGREKLSLDEKLQVGELYYNVISQDKTLVKAAKNIFIYLNKNYPDVWQPYYYLGEIDFIEGKISEAQIKMDKALSLADTVGDAHLQIGYAYFRIGLNDRAKLLLEKGIKLSPGDFRMYYFYGLVLQRSGDINNAVKNYEEAYAIAPNELSVLSNLALAYNTLKRYPESDEIHERAISLDPGNALILNNYAYNLSIRGVNLEKALQMAKTAVEKEPENPSYLDTIGWIYYKLGKFDLARKFISHALEINGRNAVIIEHLGDVCFAMKDMTGAKLYWEKSLEINPNNEDLKAKIEKVE